MRMCECAKCAFTTISVCYILETGFRRRTTKIIETLKRWSFWVFVIFPTHSRLHTHEFVSTNTLSKIRHLLWLLFIYAFCRENWNWECVRFWYNIHECIQLLYRIDGSAAISILRKCEIGTRHFMFNSHTQWTMVWVVRNRQTLALVHVQYMWNVCTHVCVQTHINSGMAQPIVLSHEIRMMVGELRFSVDRSPYDK